MSSAILVFSEQSEGSYELLTKATEFANQFGEVWALVLGKEEKAIHSLLEYGAKRVLRVPNADPNMIDAESLALVLFEIAKNDGPNILLIRSSKLGKETAGRVAQKLHAGCITDAIGLEINGSDLVAHRYTLGGNTVSSEVILTTKKVISVLPRSFEAHQSIAQLGEIEVIDLALPPPRVQVVERRKKTGESADIESAQNLVCVGQGVSRKEDLVMVNELCEALQAELGCTRPLASDFHWVSEDRMVGISGKKCKPKFHISIGVSGQIQHSMGIMNSKLIVVINKDKDAPIFKIADYGIVGDLYLVVPELIQKIRAVRT